VRANLISRFLCLRNRLRYIRHEAVSSACKGVRVQLFLVQKVTSSEVIKVDASGHSG
jgi:hypothetical protein